MKHDRLICSEQIVLRLPPPLRERIEEAASTEGRSPANMTRRILESWLAERSGHGKAA
jgi:predicted DNA-binding protein